MITNFDEIMTFLHRIWADHLLSFVQGHMLRLCYDYAMIMLWFKVASHHYFSKDFISLRIVCISSFLGPVIHDLQDYIIIIIMVYSIGRSLQERSKQHEIISKNIVSIKFHRKSFAVLGCLRFVVEFNIYNISGDDRMPLTTLLANWPI